MANTSPIQKEEVERGEPMNIGDRAIDNVRFIREMMERSASFTAVPGWGGMLMGATAIAAAFQANYYRPSMRDWLLVWLCEAALAFAIGLLTLWQKAKFVGQPLSRSTPGLKFLFSFAPPLFCGIVITLGLWRYGYFDILVPVWLLCYGAAVVCGGAFSVRPVPVMGWFFMALGSAGFLIPPAYSDHLMGVSFGLLHIIFGAIIARRYGG